MRGPPLELTKALDGHMGQGAGLGTCKQGTDVIKEKLMICEGKQPWEILPSLLLSQKNYLPVTPPPQKKPVPISEVFI